MNFVFGVLGVEEERGRRYLFTTQILEAVNSNTIATFFNDALNLLWPDGDSIYCTSACVLFCIITCSFLSYLGLKYNKILLVVTDAAPYMCSAMNALKVLLPKMIHLTCLTHGLHRVAEYIRIKYADVNSLIENGKALFSKVSIN